MTRYVVAQWARLRCEQAGVTLVEYGLLAFLVSIVSIVFLAAVGLDLAEGFDYIEDWLGIAGQNSATTGGGVSDAATKTGVN